MFEEATGEIEPVIEETPGVTPEEEPKVSVEPEKTAFDAFDKGLSGEDEGKKEPETETEEEGEPKEPKEADKPVEPKDEEKAISDEIKEFELKGKAAERFQELSGRAKPEETLELQVKADLCDQIIDSWKNVEATPEQVDISQKVIGMMNSGNPENLERVAQFYEAESAAIRKKLGTDVSAGNYAPDISQRLEDGEIDESAAKELMNFRTMEKKRVEFGEQQAQSQQQDQQIVAAREEAISQLNQLNEELSKSDPDFERKLELLGAEFETIKRYAPFEQWANEVKAAYKRVVLPKVSKDTPLRATGPASHSMAQKPKNAYQAFDLGLGKSVT